MSYSQYSKIEFTDFNSLVGTSTTSTNGELNTVWSVGNGNKGYGQTAIPQVSQHATISYTDWANVTTKTTAISNHQGTAITNVPTPVAGARIDYVPAIVNNITTVTTPRLNAALQGTSITAARAYPGEWYQQVTFTHVVTFSSGDAARYFFNAGGQLAITFSSPAGSGINALMSQLATDCGTIVLSAPTSGSITIAGTVYNGISKVGGGSTVTTLSTNTGYYALNTSNTEVFRQLATGTPAGYVGSYISVNIRTNGTQGSNGDNGSVITITTLWDQVPNGLAVSANTTTTVTARPPSTTYLPTQSWGTPTITSTAEIP